MDNMIFIEDIIGNTNHYYSCKLSTLENNFRFRELTLRELKEFQHISKNTKNKFDFNKPIMYLLKCAFQIEENGFFVQISDSHIDYFSDSELLDLYKSYDTRIDYDKLNDFLRDSANHGDILFYFSAIKEFNYNIDITRLTHSFMRFCNVAMELRKQESNTKGRGNARSFRRNKR